MLYGGESGGDEENEDFGNDMGDIANPEEDFEQFNNEDEDCGAGVDRLPPPNSNMGGIQDDQNSFFQDG